MQGIPPISGPDWKVWGRRIEAYLRTVADKMRFKNSADSPAQNGVILWDDVNGYPVVSKNGEWREIVLADGDAFFTRSTDVTAAAANTAYSITYDDPSHAHGLSKDATNPERIVFEEAGHYFVSFTAQIDASSSTSVTFHFWPAINGSDVPTSTMRNTLKSSNATLVVSRSAVFVVNANDYLEVKWAVDDTRGQLTAFAATAFSPGTPSTNLTITRMNAQGA